MTYESIVTTWIGIPGGSNGKEPVYQCTRHETQVWSLVQEDSLQEGIVIHCSILVWRIPWTEESSGVQSIGLQRIWHDWN